MKKLAILTILAILVLSGCEPTMTITVIEKEYLPDGRLKQIKATTQNQAVVDFSDGKGEILHIDNKEPPKPGMLSEFMSSVGLGVGLFRGEN
ncbi:hypothetical protein KAR91_83485 [Candidatus Pacearchaeota archaeon]|nr:hypothetical protein [Candidatus Pacearchaeota archaeon]